ncbi:hypothetical protein [Streptosporangium sandarakinum]
MAETPERLTVRPGRLPGRVAAPAGRLSTETFADVGARRML